MVEKKILIVDDDKAILESFESILKSEGYQVDFAESAENACDLSKQNYYDLAFLDIKLPGMNGTTLLRKLHESRPMMMKVMVTGHASLENAVDSVNQGADGYLTKPVKPDVLLETVKEKLAEQEEAESMSEEKVTQWVEARIRKLEQEKEV